MSRVGRVSRPAPLSGFPEWLPGERVVEAAIVDTLRDTFERHGFAGIETRAVEPMAQLTRKGENDKEIYVLRRWQEQEQGDPDGAAADPAYAADDAAAADAADAADAAAAASAADRRLGLHFDLTVPFARYVLEHAGHLDFPFRRYQIQKVWRGERPQEGRFREFTQADIDVVDRDTLPFHYEVELPLVMGEALSRLPIPPVRIQVNNRKLAEGFYRGLGLGDPDVVAGILRAVDKLDKIGPVAVTQELTARDGLALTDAQAQACLALAAITAPDASFVDQVRALGVHDPLLDEGLDELVRVVDTAAEYLPGLLVADLRIARGLDYYTGTVYETQLAGHADLGSICSGGRYDALASDGRTTYPGVGLSIGVTRLVSRLLGHGLVRVTRPVPTCVVVAVPDEQARGACLRLASTLRARGIPTEVAPTAAKYGKQIRYADRRGIPYIWFPAGAAGATEGGGHEVRDIRSGEQVPADPATWAPPERDRLPRVEASDPGV